jgi:ABC-type multidrug transport system ATPase subunit
VEQTLSIHQISKAYGKIQALKNVSFDIPPGSIFGILGPNGSGKTTLLGTVLNVLNPDSGSYSWFGGIPGDQARKQIGSILETPNFYHYLTAKQNLEISAGVKQNGLEDIDKVLQMLGLYERKDSRFHTFSLGMKQRLAIAAALLGKPRVLVLDEPTNGLDPSGIAEIRELIRLLNQQGLTIILASHLLDEVEKLCSHAAILKKGQLILNGPVDEVFRHEDLVEVKAQDLVALNLVLSQMTGIKRIQMADNSLHLFLDSNTHPAQVNEYCSNHGITLSHLLLKKKSLETKFMELTTGESNLNQVLP